MLENYAIAKRLKKFYHRINALLGGQQIKGENKMPYSVTKDLPTGIRNNLPQDAQLIYLDNFKSAWCKADKRQQESTNRFSQANRQAWAAVKHKYQIDRNGIWRNIE